MSELAEFILDLLFNVIGTLLEIGIGDFAWRDTRASRIILGLIIAVLGIIIWRELS